MTIINMYGVKVLKSAKKIGNAIVFKRFMQKSRNFKSVLTSELGDFSEKYEYIQDAKPYKSIPGPTPLPVLGNTWRFIPIVGDFHIEHIDKVSMKLFQKYGKIVKLEGILGRPDMLFLFDPNEIENVFRREDTMPFRPSMPSLNYYKHVLRKDFFGESAGVIAVHGENWQKFRSKVNQIMLQPKSAKMYSEVISSTAQEFIERIEEMRDENLEAPDDFLNEIHKWSLESLGRIALDIRMGCLDQNPPEDSQMLIDAINTFFLNVPILELKIPFWKLFNTPTFEKYIKALDCIREICLKYINKSMDNLSLEKDDNQLSVMQKVLKRENDVKLASILALDLFLVGVDTRCNSCSGHSSKRKIDISNTKMKHLGKVTDAYVIFSLKIWSKIDHVKNQFIGSFSVWDRSKEHLNCTGKPTNFKNQDSFVLIILTLRAHFTLTAADYTRQTSNAVASILYQLSIHPEKQKILHEEVDRILPNLTSEPTIEKLEQMNYLNACIKETMRMYPVVIGNGRQTTTDCVIGGFLVPKGVQIIFQHYVISNQEEFFTKCHEFTPERWLKNCPRFRHSHAFASLPFGFGKRMCLGKRFAELEIRTLLAKIIKNYRIEYHHKKLDYFIHPMYTPNGPLKLKFIRKVSKQ